MPSPCRTLAALLALTCLLLVAPAAHAARQWSDATQVAAGSEFFEDGDMAVTLRRDVVVAWRGDREADRTIKARAKLAEGWGPEKVLGGGMAASVAAVGDGNAVVAWVGSAVPGQAGDGLMVAEWTPGAGFGPPREVGTVSEYAPEPAIAGNLAGEVVISYAHEGRVWSVRRSSEGVWSPAEAVWAPDSDTSSAGQAQVGLTETGEAVFAWVGTQAGERRIRTATQRRGEPVALSTSYAVPPGGTGDIEMAVNAAGAAVLTWPEIEREDYFAGPLKAAMRAPGGAFGERLDTGGQVSDTDEAVAGVSAAGQAVITWLETRPTGSHTASGYGLRVLTGVVPAGTLGEPELISYDLADGPPRIAVDALGNAIIAFEDWDTFQWRVVRRAVSGLYGQERNPITCEGDRQYHGMKMHVDPLGNATFLWKDVDFNKDLWPMFVSQDHASARFGPDPCQPSWAELEWTPKEPQPLEEVTFDGSSARDPDGGPITYSFDFDGDGTFEVENGEDPIARHRFLEAGEHRVGFKYYQRSKREGWGGGSSWYVTVRVGMEPQEPEPPNPDPYGADPRPPDLPDENPWPYVPKLPELDLPIDLPIELPPIDLPAVPVVEDPLPAIGPASVRPVAPGAVTVAAPASVTSRTLVRKGLRVGLLSERTGRVRLRLTATRAKGTRKAARAVVAEKLVKLRAGTRLDARVRVGRARAKLLKRYRGGVVVLEARPLAKGAPVSKSVIRLAG